MPIDRTDIIAALRAALEPLPEVLAFWEAGSTAFGRADEWSDLDLHVLADDERVEAVLGVVEEALAAAGGGIELRHRVPEPTWHGHAQVFYRLAGAAPHLVIDLVVMRRSLPERFLDEERNGVPAVVFDRSGEIAPTRLDRPLFAAEVAGRLSAQRERFDLFQPFVTKEVARGNALGAVAALHAFTLRPLVEVLGMRHCPERYDYGAHYATLDFPADVVRRLTPLFYPASTADVEAVRAAAEAWFHEVVGVLDAEGVAL
jgi:predicted nucleotidyltransferase